MKGPVYNLTNYSDFMVYTATPVDECQNQVATCFISILVIFFALLCYTNFYIGVIFFFPKSKKFNFNIGWLISNIAGLIFVQKISLLVIFVTAYFSYNEKCILIGIPRDIINISSYANLIAICINRLLIIALLMDRCLATFKIAKYYYKGKNYILLPVFTVFCYAVGYITNHQLQILYEEDSYLKIISHYGTLSLVILQWLLLFYFYLLFFYSNKVINKMCKDKNLNVELKSKIKKLRSVNWNLTTFFIIPIIIDGLTAIYFLAGSNLIDFQYSVIVWSGFYLISVVRNCWYLLSVLLFSAAQKEPYQSVIDMCRAQKEEVEIPNHPQQEALICPSPRFDTSQEIIEAVINSSAEKTSFPNFSANKNDVVKEDSMYLKPPKNVRRHRKHSTNSQASTAKTVSSTDLEEVTALDRIEISEGQDSVKYLRT